ncbi:MULTISPECIES: energy transducer TonB family protein [unclassified Variovorax]|uniref:energy transducer TonB family protein n=1 Tax=unclassified Variovorax TaxID=663243 RepID=UPI003F48CA87
MKPRDPRSSTPAGPSGARAGLWRRWGGWAIGLAMAAALVALVWHLLSDTASTKRVVADAPMLMLPPPPPPPPEPEKLPEPEPEKVKPEVVEKEPKPVEPLEPPKDDAPPSPSKDLGDPVTMDSAGQAGNDAFGIQAGSGGGMSGTGGGGGLGSGSYARYVSSLLQQALSRDPRTRQLVFDDIQIDLWLGADGKTSRVQLVRGTGTPDIDEAVLTLLRGLDRVDEKPPASLRFPMRVSMRGRRP